MYFDSAVNRKLLKLMRSLLYKRLSSYCCTEKSYTSLKATLRFDPIIGLLTRGQIEHRVNITPDMSKKGCSRKKRKFFVFFHD